MAWSDAARAAAAAARRARAHGRAAPPAVVRSLAWKMGTLAQRRQVAKQLKLMRKSIRAKQGARAVQHAKNAKALKFKMHDIKSDRLITKAVKGHHKEYKASKLHYTVKRRK
jgi:hypothetical protein